jgi:hypothetical protein
MSRLPPLDERDILEAWKFERDPMTYLLRLPKKLKQWSVKIRDRERLEPPHVTVLRKTRAWRLDLRSGEFMDAEPNPDDVPKALVQFIKEDARWQELRDAWDAMYPENPIESEGKDEGESDE